MCRVLEVSPAGFYASQTRPPSARTCADQRLRLEIRTAHAASHRRYGAPKIHEDLCASGIAVSRKRVARLMRLDGLRSKRPRAFRVTTQSGHVHPVAPNELARHFDVGMHNECNRAWAADITYLWTRQGWLYLAVVLDLASRRIVGWCADARLDQTLTLRALQMALRHRRPGPGALHHSDRGVQYASGAYRGLLAQHGITCSMSRPGDCWDNAVVESFFATLKTELAINADWPTRFAAQRALWQYIEVWYNRQRRHQTLGYRTPVQYEREVLKAS
jgi:transposase InsO family protein